MRGQTERVLMVVSWVITLGWTAVLIYLLLKPGSDTTATQPFLSSFFRMEFSRTDLVEAVAHVGMFGILTLLWQRTLARHCTTRCAILASIVFAGLLGTTTEVGQFFVARSSLALDLAANYTGIGLSMVFLVLLRPLSERQETTG